MRFLHLCMIAGLTGLAIPAALHTEPLDDPLHDIVERPVDCGGLLYGYPLYRCPAFGTVTLFQTITTTVPATTIVEERTSTFYVTSTLPDRTQTSTYLTTSVTTIFSTLPASTITTTLPVTTTRVNTETSTPPPRTVTSTQQPIFLTETTERVTTQTTTQPTTVVNTQTATVTLPASTVTTTAGSQSQASNNCVFASGWQYAVFRNTPGSSWFQGSTSDWAPEDMKRGGSFTNILFSGATDFIGGFSCGESETTTIYDRGVQFQCSQFSIMHRAYFYADQAGSYTFRVYNVDDDIRFWIGPLAYQGFNNTNHNIRAAWDYNTSGAGTGSFTVTLEQGEYYPMRLAFGNAAGGSSFCLDFYGPGEDRYIQNCDQSLTQGLVLQYDCPTVDAPPFPYAFGDEL